MKRTHDGEALERMVKESGVKIGKFATLMGVGRNTPGRWFEVPQHEDSLLVRAARVLNVEVGSYFPRIGGKNALFLPTGSTVPASNNAPTSGAEYDIVVPSALPDCQRQLVAAQQKLIETLEKYNNLLVEHNQVLRNQGRPLTGGGASGGVTHSLHNAHITV